MVKWIVASGLLASAIDHATKVFDDSKSIGKDIDISKTSSSNIILELEQTNVSDSKDEPDYVNVSVKINAHYKIKKGDNLTKIAKKFNTTIDQLVLDNGIENKSKIRRGEILKVGSITRTKKVLESEVTEN